ncbi:MAG TPA: hypothetical protein DEF79_11960 [Gammaproteobacteria bacterium]|nr:hypothetical protein [Gammaproteobacteria bacterium]
MGKIYQAKMSRRDSIKRLGSMTAVIMVGGVSVACDTAKPEAPRSASIPSTGHWPGIELEPITGPTYGTDPIVSAPTAPWPLTLSEEQKDQVALLSDLICPADQRGLSASAVGVPDVIDEWVSAPYASQRRDREQIVNGLQWLNDEARLRFGSHFIGLTEERHAAIVDDIAYRSQYEVAQFALPARFFSRFRRLVFGAYFSSPEGIEDIGYIGNFPIIGDYPGPTSEAMEHIRQVASAQGLPPITEYVNQ